MHAATMERVCCRSSSYSASNACLFSLSLLQVWAFGTVLWELMTWSPPFDGLNPYQASVQRQPVPDTPGRHAHACACGSSMCHSVPLRQHREHSHMRAKHLSAPMQRIPLQIINTVQAAARGSVLAVPSPDQLPAGPLGQYSEYVALMEVCSIWCLLGFPAQTAGSCFGWNAGLGALAAAPTRSARCSLEAQRCWCHAMPLYYCCHAAPPWMPCHAAGLLGARSSKAPHLRGGCEPAEGHAGQR